MGRPIPNCNAHCIPILIPTSSHDIPIVIPYESHCIPLKFPCYAHVNPTIFPLYSHIHPPEKFSCIPKYQLYQSQEIPKSLPHLPPPGLKKLRIGSSLDNNVKCVKDPGVKCHENAKQLGRTGARQMLRLIGGRSRVKGGWLKNGDFHSHGGTPKSYKFW